MALRANVCIYHLVMTNIANWKDPPIFKFGKPSISMGHGFHGYVINNQSFSPPAR